MTTRRQAEAHKRDLAQLVAIARNDLRILLDRYSDADQARDVLIEALPRFVSIYGSAATALAADWYDDLRDEQDITGRFAPIPAELPDTERTDILARWGVGPLYQAEPDKAAAFTLVAGGLSRIIADADRYTITVSTREDPAAEGWRRVVSAGACQFCQGLAGTLYTDPAFGSHDTCGCTAAPSWT